MGVPTSDIPTGRLRDSGRLRRRHLPYLESGRWRALLVAGVGLGLVGCGPFESEVGAVFRSTGGAATAGEEPAASGGTGVTAPTPLPSDSEQLGFDLSGSPFYTRVQRLTNQQWLRAVTDILRLADAPDLGSDLIPPPEGVTEFSNNELLLEVDTVAADAFELAAESAALLATSSPAALAALSSSTESEVFVRELGRRAFRRPLTEVEEARYLQLFDRGENVYGADFANGAALVIRAMLQSPSFLYRTELGPAGEPLSGYEVASKLSFWLLGTTPSDALLDAAGTGELDDADALESTAREMLAQPAAAEVMRDFHGQLFHLSSYRKLAKTGVSGWTPAAPAELEEASYRFFDALFTRGSGVEEIFSSRRGFVGPAAAPFYGLDDAPAELEERDLGPARLGYFMQVPFLSLTGLNDEPSTIRRGGELMSALCNTLGPPSGTFAFPPVEPDQTNRERWTALTGTCGGTCHTTYLNPLGFAFEGFDGLGTARESDNGHPVDASGRYPLSDGIVEFADARALMKILARHPQTHACYAKKLASYALQRDIVDADRDLLDALTPVSLDGSFKELILALVTSPSFRVREKDLP